MSTFNYMPDYSAKVTYKPRIISAQFGDGYQQRAPDGLNHNLPTWSVTFTRAPSVIQAIDTFLHERKGVEPFNWVSPAGVNGAYITSGEWAVSYDSPGWNSLTATFAQVPERVSA